MKATFNEITLLSYDAVTGGPEAIHQLSHAINALGGRCGTAYIGGNSSAQLIQDGERCTLVASVAPNSPALAAYAKYSPRPIAEMAMCPGNLLVLPEPMADLARNISFGQRAIWWLSVDNAQLFEPRIAYKSYRDHLFSDHSLLHFYQSDYAKEFLQRNSAHKLYPLFDYTDEVFLASRAEQHLTKAPKIAYFPRKGAELAAEFIALAGTELQFAPIENMSKDQVRNVLESCAVYIDFGHHPGKDRVPREAAVSGAVVLLHERGAAMHYADHPLDTEYLFSLADVRNGTLLARVRDIVNTYSEHYTRQSYYRQKIANEKEEFFLQAKTLFFNPD